MVDVDFTHQLRCQACQADCVCAYSSNDTSAGFRNHLYRLTSRLGPMAIPVNMLDSLSGYRRPNYDVRQCQAVVRQLSQSWHRCFQPLRMFGGRLYCSWLQGMQDVVPVPLLAIVSALQCSSLVESVLPSPVWWLYEACSGTCISGRNRFFNMGIFL